MDKLKLREFCNSIGLKCMGIAGVGPYYDLEKKLIDRIEKNYITGMEEEVLEKRINPKLTLEDANSVIVIAFPYYIGECENSNISKYCYGKDYHIVVKDKLQQICDYIDKEVEGFNYKIFSDNGPLVDRYMAYLAGIGYFGINNNIITDQYGSYVFIGYIINNYEFVLDKPTDKTCLKCGKCVKYCPGNALLGNYNMDPRKCLSYISQKKGDLSKDEEKKLNKNKKVFGCDICQEVCPHNIGIKTTDIDEFKEDLIKVIDHEEINNISNKEFKRRYKDRAFSWRGKNIIKRNLEIISKEFE